MNDNNMRKLETVLVLVCLNIAFFLLIGFIGQCNVEAAPRGERVPNKQVLPGGNAYGQLSEFEPGDSVDVRGIATVFGGRKDKWRGGRSWCLIPARPISRSHWGIAHRTWPCGTMVLICTVRTSKCVFAPVIDRGPYPIERCPGKKGRVLKRGRRRRRGCRIQRAGVADLTFPVARAMWHNGKERVTLRRLF